MLLKQEGRCLNLLASTRSLGNFVQSAPVNLAVSMSTWSLLWGGVTCDKLVLYPGGFNSHPFVPRKPGTNSVMILTASRVPPGACSVINLFIVNDTYFVKSK